MDEGVVGGLVYGFEVGGNLGEGMGERVFFFSVRWLGVFVLERPRGGNFPGFFSALVDEPVGTSL